LSFAEVIAATGGEQLREAGTVATGVAIDSRKVRMGDVFFAVKGDRFDGHRFVDDAVKAGAVGAVISDRRWVPRQGAAIAVEDTRRALGDLARWHRGRMNVRVAAVTGSNGKTTTRMMLAAILRSGHRVVEAPANYNNDIGVPLTAFLLEPETEFAVFEVEMNEPGGTARLCDICRPELGVVTNIGDTHLEHMKDRAGVAREKAELLEALPESGSAVLNHDDELVRDIGKRYARCRKLWYGLDEGADLRAVKVKDRGLDGVGFVVENGPGVKLKVPGRHNVSNCLAAIAAAREFGVDPEAAARALRKFESPPMRLRVLKLGQGITVIDDTYNANPQSVHAALDVLCDHECAGDRLVFLGDMLEMGERALKVHTDMGLHVASCVDRAVFVGPLGEHAVAVALKRGVGAGRLRAFHRSDDVLPGLVDMVRPGDTILVKGSRATEMEKITQALVENYGQEPGQAD